MPFLRPCVPMVAPGQWSQELAHRSDPAGRTAARSPPDRPMVSAFDSGAASGAEPKAIADESKHKEPHIHAEYAGKWAVLSMPEGNVLEADADFPAKKVRMVQTWIDIHAEELMAAWSLAVRHLHPTKIRGLDQ